MNKNCKIAILLVILILISLIGALIYLSMTDSTLNQQSNSNIQSNDLNGNSNGITTNSDTNESILGSNDKGTVELIGPFGNTNSNVKIAYIIGVHPLESTAHQTLYDSIKEKNSSLKYCYYIYKINVTKNPNDDSEGRMNGQLLANEFIVPDVTKKDYNLVVDVHSNQGTNGGNYKETNFIFAPNNNTKSKTIAETLISNIPGLVYYFPESQTSPSFVTIPIIESGTPAIIYETYRYEPLETTQKYINELISQVDKLNL